MKALPLHRWVALGKSLNASEPPLFIAIKVFCLMSFQNGHAAMASVLNG